MSYAPDQHAPLHDAPLRDARLQDARLQDARAVPAATTLAPSASPDPHIVIVGGGFAGLAAAQELKHAPARVTLIDRSNHHLFQPLLYQVATAELSAGEIAQPIRHVLRNCRNIRVLMAEMVGLEPQARRVLLKDGAALSYDFLILATGAAHGYFGHPEWATHAPGLKSLQDAQRIRNRLLLTFEAAEKADGDADRERLMTIAVIGGGPTGVEMAGAIAELARRTLKRDFRRIDPVQTRILLFEAGPRLLPQFPEDLSAYTARALKRLGVDVRCNSAVENISDNGVTAAGSLVPAGAVIWAAGLSLPPLGRWLDATTDRHGRVAVEPDLSIPRHPEIFVLGDAAFAKAQDGSPLPGLAQVAHQQGRYLGRALVRHLQAGSALPPFRYRSRGNLATIGRNAAVTHFDSFKLRGFPAWVIWGIVHVFLLIGFENRLLVSIRWLWAYLTAQRSARLILGEATDRR